MPDHFLDSSAPVTFGKYLLDEELARGGMSRVFRARLQGPAGFEKTLVVKQILPELASDTAFVELFVREANTLVQLSHPNLVPVYELGVVDGVYFLAMEWVRGATVDQLLRAGPLPAAQVAQIGAQIAEALHYAHERFHIVHRDVTPRNVIIDAAGHARLLDFGIAARAEHTGHGELFGSPGYMAPEQLRGDALGPASDLFALGCVLYEAASGIPAWPSIRSAADFEASPRPAALKDVDDVLAELILGLLASDRAERPQSANLVADRLRTWLAEHHPRGLLPELSARVVEAQAFEAAHPTLKAEPPRVSSGRIEVRSIAVSPELSALLREATERIERPVPAAVGPTPSAAAPATLDDSMANDPEAHRVARRFLRDIVIVTLALIAGLFYARSQPPDNSSAASTPPASIQRPAVPEPEPTPVVPTSTPEPAPAAPATAGAESDAVAGNPKRGSLSVSAAPWAEVRIDGRLIGTTPRRSVPLRPGKHVVALSCPPLAHSAQLAIDISAGQELHVSANMHESPARMEVH
jgi:serine/threonine protein kinase